MRGDWNLRRYFQILVISIFIILIIFTLFGTIALESREENIADKHKHTYTFNYTFKIETYLPSSYTIKLEDNASYVLSGTSFSGKSLEIENTLEQNVSAKIECVPGLYKLRITSTSSQRKKPIIEKKFLGRSFYQISPLLIYFLTIFLAMLFSVSDLSNYFFGKNKRYSNANISFPFFWILQFLFELSKSGFLKEKEIDRLNLELKRPHIVASHREVAGTTTGELQDKIKKIVESKNDSNDAKYDNFAKGVVIAKELSKRIHEKALAFKPSYLYYLIEFICNMIIKKIYFPRSIQILERVSSLEYTDKIEENIKFATEMITFDSTYPSIILAMVVSILSFFGISLINVPLSFLLGELLIIFYLFLNITMIFLYFVELRVGGKKWTKIVKGYFYLLISRTTGQ